MNTLNSSSRRAVLKSACGALLSTFICQKSLAEDLPLLSEDDPAAKAVHYVADVSRAKDAKPGNTCANCSLYSGDKKSMQGSCAIFGNKQVKANGWCSSWTNM